MEDNRSTSTASKEKMLIVEMDRLNEKVYVATNEDYCRIEKAAGEYTRVKCVLLNNRRKKVGLMAYRLRQNNRVVISMRDYVRAAVSYDENWCSFKLVDVRILDAPENTKLQLIVRENHQLFLEAKEEEKKLYLNERKMLNELAFAESFINKGGNNSTVSALASQQRVLKYAPVCFVPDKEYRAFLRKVSAVYVLPEFLHTVYRSDSRCTHVKGIYYAQLKVFISSDVEEKRNYCSSKQPYCLIYHGYYKEASSVAKSITLTMNEANPKYNTFPQENQIKRERVSSEVVNMSVSVIHIYTTIDELQRKYNLNAIHEATNKIPLKPRGNYELKGYYTPDKNFCSLKKDLMNAKKIIMGADISLIIEGAIARNDSDIKSLRLPILFKASKNEEVKTKLTPIGYKQKGESEWTRNTDMLKVIEKMMMREREEREKKFGKLAKYQPIDGVNLSYGLPQDKKVNLYSLFCHCSACIEKYGTDTIVDCNALVATRKGALERVTVQFCQGCGRYFMNYATFEAYNKRYGGILCECTFSNVNGQYENEFGFAPDSILSRCGYSVKAEISQDERQCILQFILDSGRASKWELQELMSRFINIRMNMPSMQGAIERWKEDIAFVADYKADAQTDVGIATIKQVGKIAPK
jgi:hypothetical protein